METSSDDNTSAKKGKAPLKLCPIDKGGCGAYVALVVLKCPHCQYDFDLAKLVTVLGSERLISHRDRLKMEKYRSLLRLGYQSNFAPSWVRLNFEMNLAFFLLLTGAEAQFSMENKMHLQAILTV